MTRNHHQIADTMTSLRGEGRLETDHHCVMGHNAIKLDEVYKREICTVKHAQRFLLSPHPIIYTLLYWTHYYIISGKFDVHKVVRGPGNPA